jgi:hypothetical protein
MSGDIDIVDRLRINWTSLTYKQNAERNEAADEIERLRGVLHLSCIDIFNTTAERDEARREACLFKSRRKNGVMSPMEIARLRGWDCFKEKK